MNVLGYLQRIGRALMVPVATLPAAAIMMGIGYWIDPVGWGAQSALAAFLIKAGAAIIDNMSVLFAIGVAYGMSKDKDGAALFYTPGDYTFAPESIYVDRNGSLAISPRLVPLQRTPKPAAA